MLVCIVIKAQVHATVKADHLPEDDMLNSSRTPLFPIGLAIGTVLMVPVILYSVGPKGPMKAG